MSSAIERPLARPGNTIETAPLGLLVLQPTTFCNIDCRYCYLSQRSENHRMSPHTVQAVARFVRDIPLRDQRLSVVWHAGEPLAAPVAFYETAFRTLKAEAGPIEFEHHIQTNATLINDEWCALFKQWGVHVGVSIDGPKAINDAHRVDRANRGTFDRVMRGIAKLREHGIPFTVIGVLTQDALKAPEDFWAFFETLGATQVAFNVEEQEGINALSTLTEDGYGDFRRFVERIAELRRSGPKLRQREFDGMRGHLTAPPGSDLQRADNMPGAIINIDFEGNVTTFSPELLGAEHDDYGTFHWGNVHRDDWQGVVSHPNFRKAYADILAGVALCRETCAYFSVCGGGNPSNKLTELGTFAGTETQFCKLHIQTFADVVIEELERELSSGDLKEDVLPQSNPVNTGASKPAKEVDIYLAGAGIAFPAHLTIETVEILTACKRICTNLQESMLTGLPQDLKDKCISLWPLYQDGRIRSENYNDVFNAIVEIAEVERPIAWLTPGHPVIFDSVTTSLLNAGKLRGWNVRVIPAISSIDTMLAELGFDPAHGMLIHEATGLVRRRIPLHRTVAAMLLQPAVFDVNVAIIDAGSKGPDLSPLRDYIAEFHAPDHKCAFIRSSSGFGEPDLVTWTALRDLTNVPYDRIAGSTLFVPPA